MDFLIFYLIYIVAAICYFLWIVVRSKNRLFTSLIAFWVLSFPILNRDEFMLHTPWGFDLSPSRLFLIFGLIAVTITGVTNIKNYRRSANRQRLLTYEWFMLAYILVSSAMIIIKAPGFREMMPLVSGQIVFAVMYFIARDHLHPYDKKQVEKLIIWFGCLSVLVSVVQFFNSPEFFRISSERLAFGSFTRANGFMLDEYDNGLFLTCLVALVVTQDRPVRSKLMLAILFGIGVLLTMHRGSWLIFGLSIVILFLISLRNRDQQVTKRLLFMGYFSSVLGVLFALIYPNLTSRPIFSQDFIYDQLTRDTVKIRLDLAEFGLNLVGRRPEGIGDFNFPEYAQFYYDKGMPLHYGKPLIVHNGFIAAANKYGVLGGLLFVLVLLSTILFALKGQGRYTANNRMVFLICVSLIVINLTQDMSALGSFPQVVIAYFIGMSRRLIN